MAASAPPATTMSTSPFRILLNALAMASVPDAHADTAVLTPALA